MITSVRVDKPDVAPYFLCGRSSKDSYQLSGEKAVKKVAGQNRLKVLVVDDEDLIADSVVEILNRSGYDATAKYSGKAAIQYVKRQCPDVIVADVIMPDFNGIQLARAIRRHCPEMRVVLFSGNAASPDLLHHASTEGESFELLSKPVHPLQLLKALKS